MKTLKHLIVDIGRREEIKGREEGHRTKEEKIQREGGRKGKEEGRKERK